MTTPPNNIGSLLLFASNYWGQGPITFSVPVAGSTWSYANEPNAAQYSVLSVAQAARFLTAVAAWDRLIARDLVQTDDLAAPGAIRIAFTNYAGILESWGYAYVPPNLGGSGSSRSGDIWINSTYKNASFAAGGYDFSSMLHEVGHALGLTHPHDVSAFPAAWDSGEWTVMSYNDDYGRFYRSFFQSAGGFLQTIVQGVYTSTPMVLDIQAIQLRYGADPTTASGNDTYTFDENSRFMQSIYDAGGIDLIDLSAHTRGSIIDLGPGAYSSIAKFTIQAQTDAAVALFGASFAGQIFGALNHADTYTWTNNLGIAFSTTIENAKGGSGADEISGNAVSNRLEGGGGADKLFGLAGDDFLIGDAGNDILDGGAGTDIAIYGTASTSATWTQGAGGWTVNAGGFGVDTLTGIEILRFADRDVALAALGPGINGGTGNDILAGTISDEAINGLAGDDQITGAAGADTLDGGAGVDTAVFSGNRITYTITKVGTGGTITGPDGTDTIINIEWLKFGDQTIRFRPGNGTSVNINDPASYAANLRDFDGNNLGSASGWKLIGNTDIQKDGDIEHILVNQALGRWATIGPAEDGLVYFGDHGWAGDTRVVGIYTDPLVQSGQVTQGGPFDSQRRFANDLTIGNIKGVLGGGDYDKDGFQEVYFSLSDGSAFLHAYMHADGNIRYANYQSQQQVIDFLTANGFSSSTWAGWFGA